jgi:hypothetical protein
VDHYLKIPLPYKKILWEYRLWAIKICKSEITLRDGSQY